MVTVVLKNASHGWLRFSSSLLISPSPIRGLSFLFCHSGMLAALHCKFKAHSGNHWGRPGNRHSFVRRENKRWRKHGAVEFSKSLWQRELSNNAVNHTWTGRNLSTSTRTHTHTIMENFSMIGYPTFLQERGPRRKSERRCQKADNEGESKRRDRKGDLSWARDQSAEGEAFLHN